MLVEKEIIAPGTYWYTDEKTGLPRKLDVTPELTKYWKEQGEAMLSSGLTVPVPFEHDFNAHPMTPKDKLLNNSGWVKEYRLKQDKLFGVLDIQDEDIAKKLPRTIRWTSPWINSFTDGQGKQWNNVISHLALTTRPRVTKQAPFGSVAAALSMAAEIKVDSNLGVATGTGGFCLSRAGRLVTRKKTGRLQPQYPMAFSLTTGISLAEDSDKKKMPPLKDDGEDDDSDSDGESSSDSSSKGGDGSSDGKGGGLKDGGGGGGMMNPGLMNPMLDGMGDVKMEELLCDLLTALGIQMPDNVGEAQFKRALYEAAMNKIKELTSQAQAQTDASAMAGASNTTSPAGANPLQAGVQQEQQPMYMSLEDINKLPDPMKGVALAMYAENQKLRGEIDASKKITDSLRDAKLKEAGTARAGRVAVLSRLSPKVKADLEAMLALPSMALSMGDGGTVVDPMAQTLLVLEKGLSDMPRLLTTDHASLSIVPQPTDTEMSREETDKIADDMARAMGCPPEQKKAS